MNLENKIMSVGEFEIKHHIILKVFIDTNHVCFPIRIVLVLKISKILFSPTLGHSFEFQRSLIGQLFGHSTPIRAFSDRAASFQPVIKGKSDACIVFNTGDILLISRLNKLSNDRHS